MLEVTFQLLDPSEWKLAAYGGFFREENMKVLEARSLMYAALAGQSFDVSRWKVGRVTH